MTGLEYEKVVANYLRNCGYKNVKVTKGSGDYGIDVIAYKSGLKYAVQCKYYSSPVGLSAVQEAFAGKAMYGCNCAMVVTNSTFTKAAHELAKVNNVTLVENVHSAKHHWLPVKLRVILLLVYLFFASAILSATYDMIKDQPFILAAYNVVSTLLVLTFPFWIAPLLKALWRAIKKLFANIKTKKSSPQTPPATSVNITPQPLLYADPDQIKQWLDIFPGSPIQFAIELCEMEHPTISQVQRKLSLGFSRASLLLEFLAENELLTKISDTQYQWTEKAK